MDILELNSTVRIHGNLNLENVFKNRNILYFNRLNHFHLLLCTLNLLDNMIQIDICTH